MAEYKKRDIPKPPLASVGSTDSYDDIDDQNLSTEEQNLKEGYYRSIFTKVRVFFLETLVRFINGSFKLIELLYEGEMINSENQH